MSTTVADHAETAGQRSEQNRPPEDEHDERPLHEPAEVAGRPAEQRDEGDRRLDEEDLLPAEELREDTARRGAEGCADHAG